ncbi:MAG: cupin domain-containing protein [Chloroflexota bacterium]|nr:cupin domain-containing protein [Chloroflexota bacterium]
MHVAPAGFRSVRTGRLVAYFAMLGEVAYVLAELPRTGSEGTGLEEPCVRPHWAFVVDGTIGVEVNGSRRSVPAGNAFHVPAGLEHRLYSTGPARLAGFESARAPDPGEIVASAVAMGDRILTRARFGPRSGYTSAFCDLPHWGLVTAGSLAIEWEDDVEVVTAGDVFRCASGPPGHRFIAADPAAMIDFTPAAAIVPGIRVPGWRQLPSVSERRRGSCEARKTVEVSPLL